MREIIKVLLKPDQYSKLITHVDKIMLKLPVYIAYRYLLDAFERK